MKSQTMNTILGIAGAVVIVALIAVGILWTTQRDEAVTNIRPTPRPLAAEIPPIDSAAPNEVATATFALG
jgi:FtsZ-interacting cell division protein ZipA